MGMQASMTFLTGWFLFICVLLSCGVLVAQEAEVLSEVDVNLKLTTSVRTILQASSTREGGDPTQLAIGPSLELYV